MKTIDILHRALAARDRLMADERILHAEITGSVRRGLPEVNDLDLLIVTNDPWAFQAEPGERPRDPEREADLFVATPETYGAVLAYSTGPHALNRLLREKAREKGYLFDFASDGSDDAPAIEFEHGPFIGLHALDGTPVPTPTEERFFRLIGVPHMPPVFREWLATQL